MKKVLFVSMILVISYAAVVLAGEIIDTPNPAPAQKVTKPGITAFDNATVGPNGMSMPIGKFILVRKGQEYCAVKFTSTWLADRTHDYQTAYESYYQGDGSGDFKKGSIKFSSGDLLYTRDKSWFEIPFTSSTRDTVECGKMKFKWFHKSGLNFDDYELAPTPWEKITDVNAHDTRLKWFRKDTNRKKTLVPIDQF